MYISPNFYALAVWVVIWMTGFAICDWWLHLTGSWMFFGGAITVIIAAPVCDAITESQRQ